MSSYAPVWVKTNQRRFPALKTRRSGNGDSLAFSRDNIEADARAFAAFMRHLREVDGSRHTVVMVQVENEIGMIPDSRDRSAIANKLFSEPAPAELLQYLGEHKESLARSYARRGSGNGSKMRGTWEEVLALDRKRTNTSWPLFRAFHEPRRRSRKSGI